MNLIEGTAPSRGNIDVAGAKLPVAGDHTVQDGQPIVYGIRPEHLELADEGMEATIAVVEPTGSEAHVMLRMSITAVFRERHDFQPGQTVHCGPGPSSHTSSTTPRAHASKPHS